MKLNANNALLHLLKCEYKRTLLTIEQINQEREEGDKISAPEFNEWLTNVGAIADESKLIVPNNQIIKPKNQIK